MFGYTFAMDVPSNLFAIPYFFGLFVTFVHLSLFFSSLQINNHSFLQWSEIYQ